eukprot:2782598-Amphidinium_carterae.2
MMLSSTCSSTDVQENSLIVDFANRHVGGGCFHSGFVQEEQMVAQSTDLAAYLYNEGPVTLDDRQVFSLQNVYMDAWWTREAAAKKERLLTSDIQDAISMPCCCRIYRLTVVKSKDMHTGPFTVLAVNAPNIGGAVISIMSRLHVLHCCAGVDSRS